MHFSSVSKMDRRVVLRLGMSGIAGLGLGDLLRLRASASAAASGAPETSCILVWLGGGPSHLDTYDLKSDAPAEYRGPLRPIRTRVPGLDICELLPRQAQVADKFALVRSCHHIFAGHQDGSQHVLTGYPAVLTNGGTTTSVYPELGAVTKKMRATGPSGLPSYVTIEHRLGNVGPAYLGQGYEPLVVAANPDGLGFQVPNLQLCDAIVAHSGDHSTPCAAISTARATWASWMASTVKR